MIAMCSVNYVLNGVLVAGTQDGGLVKFNGTTASKPIKQHTDAIWAIEPKGSQGFVTGASDGKIITWNAQMKPTGTIDMTPMVKFSPAIRSIDVHKDGRMLVGTRGADVVELDTRGKITRTIVQGHSQGVPHMPEIWGLCTHPS
jgi:WD40 repeat protein